MNLAVLTLMINAGLCVLIWIVQLVVYPSFCHYSEAEIKYWHPIYTVQITYIVLPLMLGQLGVYVYTAMRTSSWQTLLILALVVGTWLVTFLISVPLHSAIDQQADSMLAREKLIQTNWIRTFIWSLILVLSVLFYGK
ncbi:MAG: hypothetical protein AAFZ63_02770 [Bacteroidota bacterium]